MILKALHKVGTVKWNLGQASTGSKETVFGKTIVYAKKCQQICANVVSLLLTEQILV